MTDRKKYFLNTVVILIVFFIGLTIGNVVLAGSNSDPGSEYDPLVAQSYVHQEIGSRVSTLNQKVIELQDQISNLQDTISYLEKQVNNTDKKNSNENENEQEIINGYVNTQVGINLRTGPGIGYEKVAVISYNTEVQILAQASDWYQINVEGKTGWANKDYITLK